MNIHEGKDVSEMLKAEKTQTTVYRATYQSHFV